ncbi:SGNH/GDSL hydrolase family protein [Micromonospora sp. DR5-3]|uniref:SGNH/GDSL hydrolase family protein n=1 Tax=unclassified Micromonospora TaxID=2617518 RepID=UPI0011D5BF89|nr:MULTISPECIES: SGNH/GDSL hydrolase family protein [unclassified Micromonospora]MCW3816714.1 SGNH/GDSL hydrolase family protein [Micromonospora sp. DR5-3]TYC22571.1 SGNH/GDSL hydrolase family protein [Micromonospora sp. MP36]
MTVAVPRGGRVLFIGDSITDAGRDRSCGDDLGTGYAMMAAAWFTARHPEHRVSFRNRGISGDRVRDLRARWADDCLALAPQVVSVLIGINDTWRRYSKHDPTSADEFARDYRHILQETRRLGARLVLVEPFVVPLDDAQRGWREDLDPKVDVVRRLAAEFDATLVAVDDLFQAADVDDRVWTRDGVHPTPFGHALIAQAWLRAVTPTA